jgi:hypothetical protein
MCKTLEKMPKTDTRNYYENIIRMVEDARGMRQKYVRNSFNLCNRNKPRAYLMFLIMLKRYVEIAV